MAEACHRTVVVCLPGQARVERGNNKSKENRSFAIAVPSQRDAGRTRRQENPADADRDAKMVFSERGLGSFVVEALGEYLRVMFDLRTENYGKSKSGDDNDVVNGTRATDTRPPVRDYRAVVVSGDVTGKPTSFNSWDARSQTVVDCTTGLARRLRTSMAQEVRLATIRLAMELLCAEANALAGELRASLLILVSGETLSGADTDALRKEAEDSWRSNPSLLHSPALSIVLLAAAPADEQAPVERTQESEGVLFRECAFPITRLSHVMTALAVDQYRLSSLRIVGIPFQGAEAERESDVRYQAVDVLIPRHGCRGAKRAPARFIWPMDSPEMSNAVRGVEVIPEILCWKSIDRRSAPLAQRCLCSHVMIPRRLASHATIALFAYAFRQERIVELVRIPKEVVSSGDEGARNFVREMNKVKSKDEERGVGDNFQFARSLSSSSQLTATHSIVAHGLHVRMHCIDEGPSEVTPLPDLNTDVQAQLRIAEFGQEVLDRSMLRRDVGLHTNASAHMKSLTTAFPLLDAETLLFSSSLSDPARRLVDPLLRLARQTNLSDGEYATCSEVLTTLHSRTEENDVQLFPQLPTRHDARKLAYDRLWAELVSFLGSFRASSSRHEQLYSQARTRTATAPATPSAVSHEAIAEQKPLIIPPKREGAIVRPIENLPVLEERTGEIHRAELFTSFRHSDSPPTESAWSIAQRAERQLEERHWQQRDASQAPARSFQRGADRFGDDLEEQPEQKRRRLANDAQRPENDRASLYFHYWGAAFASRSERLE